MPCTAAACEPPEPAEPLITTCLAVARVRYRRISFDPPLPGLRQQMADRLPMGSIIKTVTFYETAWWREKGYSGVMFSDTYVTPLQFMLP